MKRFLLCLCLLGTGGTLMSQYVYTINADSVRITNHCDTAELIIENHTQTVPGFLFNKGRGRTEFRRALQPLNATTYLIGGDTLFMPHNAWTQGGNTWGATGILGTLDNNHLDIYTNSLQQARFTNTGNLLLGSSSDAGYKLQLTGNGSSGAMYFNPTLSNPDDRIVIGGAINNGDGQNSLIKVSSDGGGTFTPILAERNGMIAFGNSGVPTFGWWIGSPAIRNFPDGRVGIASPQFYYGQDGGPFNASQLLTTVSNTNEWQTADAYPNGQNYYYFGTILNGSYSGYQRAPLKISAQQLMFNTGSEVEAARLDASGNLSVGTTSGGGYKLMAYNPTGYGFNSTARYNAFNNPAPIPMDGPVVGITSNNGSETYGQLMISDAGSVSRFALGVISNSAPNYAFITIHDGNNGNLLPMLFASSEYHFRGGSVAIGWDAPPTAQLQVGGTVRFSGIQPDNTQTHVLVCDDNGNLFYRNLASWSSNGVFKTLRVTPAAWADYVFDKNYRLPSLAAVNSYIQKNNHLPGMPSAADVKQHGIDVGETQAALLKKIEELTLYVIQQDLQLKKQEAELEQLKKQNNELETIKQQIAELKKLVSK